MICGSMMGCLFKFFIPIFSVIFALGGFVMLVVGVIMKINEKDVLAVVGDDFPVNLSVPSTLLITIGAITFVVAYFGCCGSVCGNFFMVLTYTLLLLTLFVVQVATTIYILHMKEDGSVENSFNKEMKEAYDKYFDASSPEQTRYILAVNAMQSLVECCGYKSYREFPSGQIPLSCCKKKDVGVFCEPNEAYSDGCESKVVPYIQSGMNILGNIALGIAVIELFGLIVSSCMVFSMIF